MKNTIARALSISFVTLLVLNALYAVPVFSGFPPHSYAGPGAGYATFYVSPQDSNFTSSKPITTLTGTWFSVEVRLGNHSNVASWQFLLIWKTGLLSIPYPLFNVTKGVVYIFQGIPSTGVVTSVDPYNGTHTGLLASDSTYGGVEAPPGLDSGVVVIWFRIEADPDPPEPNKLSTMLYLAEIKPPSIVHKTWTQDTNTLENDCTMLDGYYENKYVAPPPAYLEAFFASTVKEMPEIEGDRIVGTPRALFSMDILIKRVSAIDELFFVQLRLIWNPSLIKLIWIDEGTFMNDPAWAWYGTTDNMTIIDPPIDPTHQQAFYWIMINPNGTGYWDQTTWPSGDGLLATARFEVIAQGEDSDGGPPKELYGSSPVDIEPVFGQYFLGHPNLPDPPYLPFDPAVDGRVDIYCYYWSAPVAVKDHVPKAMVGTPVFFDGSGSYDLDGWIVNYEWDFGDGNITSGFYPTITHVYTAPAIYSVALTVTDNDGKTGTVRQPIEIFFKYKLTIIVTNGECPDGGTTDPPPGVYEYLPDEIVTVTAIPNAGHWFRWYLDSIYAGTTNPIDVLMDSDHTLEILYDWIVIDVYVQYPSPYGGQGLNKPADMFEPQKTVRVWALVHWRSSPVQSKLVTFLILSPHGDHDFSRSAETDSNGIAYIEFGLPWPCVDPENEVFGIWTIIAKVDIRCTIYEDQVYFKHWWLFEITNVVPKKTLFEKGEWAGFDIYYRTYRMQPVWILKEITVYDDLDVPIGSVREWVLAGFGNYDERRFWACTFWEGTEQLYIYIPKWAFRGTGKVFANAFTWDPTNPYGMGVPTCPEKFATFIIW